MTKEQIRDEVNALHEQYLILKQVEERVTGEINKLQNEFIMERGKFEERMKALTKEMGLHDKDHIVLLLKGLVD